MVDPPARRRAPSKAAQRSAGVRSLVADTLRDAIVDFDAVPDAAVEPAELVEVGAAVSPPQAQPASGGRRRSAQPRVTPAAPPRRAPAERARRRATEWTERDEFLADMAAAALALEPVASAPAGATAQDVTVPAVTIAPDVTAPAGATAQDVTAPAATIAPDVTAPAATIAPVVTAPAAAAPPRARASRRRTSAQTAPPAAETVPPAAEAVPRAADIGQDRYAALENLMEVRNRTDAAAETNSGVLAELLAQVRALQEEVTSLRSGDAEAPASPATRSDPPGSTTVPASEEVRVGMTRRAALMTVVGVFLAFVLAAVFLLIVVRGL